VEKKTGGIEERTRKKKLQVPCRAKKEMKLKKGYQTTPSWLSLSRFSTVVLKSHIHLSLPSFHPALRLLDDDVGNHTVMWVPIRTLI
jgi:hypothetical protein